MDPTGALYIADSGNNRVRKVYNGVIITVFNTPAPTGVALDSTGMLYIAAASYFGTVVQQITGIASARDVTLDAAGDVYFTSGGFVMEIPSGGNVTTIAGSGNSPYFGGDGGRGYLRATLLTVRYRRRFDRQLVYRRHFQQSHSHGNARRRISTIRGHRGPRPVELAARHCHRWIE